MRFSKKIVALVIGLNVVFTIAIMVLFLKTGSEPSTLIASFFGFTGVELLSLASITKTKEKVKGGGTSDKYPI